MTRVVMVAGGACMHAELCSPRDAAMSLFVFQPQSRFHDLVNISKKMHTNG